MKAKKSNRKDRLNNSNDNYICETLTKLENIMLSIFFLFFRFVIFQKEWETGAAENCLKSFWNHVLDTSPTKPKFSTTEHTISKASFTNFMDLTSPSHVYYFLANFPRCIDNLKLNQVNILVFTHFWWR